MRRKRLLMLLKRNWLMHRLNLSFAVLFRKILVKLRHVASLIFRPSALAYELSVKLGVLRYVFFTPAGILGDVDLSVAPWIS